MRDDRVRLLDIQEAIERSRNMLGKDKKHSSKKN